MLDGNWVLKNMQLLFLYNVKQHDGCMKYIFSIFLMVMSNESFEFMPNKFNADRICT
jgi:hypothetical protein